MMRAGLLFLLELLLVAGLVTVSYAVGVRNQPIPPPLQVDTVYSPPPGISELFSVECRWIPDGETS